MNESIENNTNWQKWLANHLASKVTTSRNYYGDSRNGSLQAAYMAQGMILPTDNKKRSWKNVTRVELNIDISSKWDEECFNKFVTEFENVLKKCYIRYSKAVDVKKTSHTSIGLDVYFWSGSTLFRSNRGSSGTLSMELSTLKEKMAAGDNSGFIDIHELRKKNKLLRPKDEIVSVVLTDYNFGSSGQSLYDTDELNALQLSDDPKLLWVCLPGNIDSMDKAKELTPVGDICLL